MTRQCELNAFKRLEKTIKKDFLRLPICILTDSLYSNSPVMDICKSNKWEYIIRFKTGSIKTLGKEFKTIKDIIKTGRKRWEIENEGFNTQKNHGYEVHHLKSTNVNAMKNHYLLIQIAHRGNPLDFGAAI